MNVPAIPIYSASIPSAFFRQKPNSEVTIKNAMRVEPCGDHIDEADYENYSTKCFCGAIIKQIIPDPKFQEIINVTLENVKIINKVVEERNTEIQEKEKLKAELSKAEARLKKLDAIEARMAQRVSAKPAPAQPVEASVSQPQTVEKPLAPEVVNPVPVVPANKAPAESVPASVSNSDSTQTIAVETPASVAPTAKNKALTKEIDPQYNATPVLEESAAVSSEHIAKNMPSTVVRVGRIKRLLEPETETVDEVSHPAISKPAAQEKPVEVPSQPASLPAPKNPPKTPGVISMPPLPTFPRKADEDKTKKDKKPKAVKARQSLDEEIKATEDQLKALADKDPKSKTKFKKRKSSGSGLDELIAANNTETGKSVSTGENVANLPATAELKASAVSQQSLAEKPIPPAQTVPSLNSMMAVKQPAKANYISFKKPAVPVQGPPKKQIVLDASGTKTQPGHTTLLVASAPQPAAASPVVAPAPKPPAHISAVESTPAPAPKGIEAAVTEQVRQYFGTASTPAPSNSTQGQQRGPELAAEIHNALAQVRAKKAAQKIAEQHKLN